MNAIAAFDHCVKKGYECYTLTFQDAKKLDDFVKLPAAASHLQPLYETFVADFEHRLNKLALARVQIAVAKQLGDIAQQAFFCKTAAEEKNPNAEAASVALPISQRAESAGVTKRRKRELTEYYTANGRRIAQEGHYIIHARPDDAGYWRIERMMWSARARE